MKKRKYSYTKKQEDDILEAANFVTGVLFLVGMAIGITVSVYLFITHFIVIITATIIMAITATIIIFWRALIVVNHHKNVKSQDDNIEDGEQ